MKNNDGKSAEGAARAGRGMMILLLINLCLAVAGGIAVLVMFQSVHGMQHRQLGRAQDDYLRMVDFQKGLYDLWKKSPMEKIHDIPTNPNDLFSFIKDSHVRSGIEEAMREQVTPRSRETPEGTEHSYEIRFKSDASRKLKRNHIVQFLAEVERGRTFLKSRSIRLSFSPQAPEEISSVDITLAYTVPKTEKK